MPTAIIFDLMRQGEQFEALVMNYTPTDSGSIPFSRNPLAVPVGVFHLLSTGTANPTP